MYNISRTTERGKAMRRPRIPKSNRDVRARAFLRNFCRIALYCAYIALWAVGYEFYLLYPINKPFVWWVMLIFCAAVAISGWIIFDMTKFLFERSFSGRIESMKVTRSYGRGVTRRGKLKIDYHTFRVLYVRNENGKRKKIRFQLFDDGYDLYYREGDRIVYFRGTRYPLCIEAEERGEHICVLCGVRVNEPKHHGEREVDTDRCEACRRSLIKVSELKIK